MPVQRRLAIIGIFFLGALVVIVGIVRLTFYSLTYYLLPSSQLYIKNRRNPIAEAQLVLQAVTLTAENNHATAYCSIIETNVGILSACLPTLRPLYQGYHIDSAVSKMSRFFRGSRSTNQSRDNIHLNSLEQDLPDNDSDVPRARTHDPYTAYDDLDLPAQRPEVFLRHK